MWSHLDPWGNACATHFKSNPSDLKANAAEVLKHLAEQREALVITQNGEAKAVLQDVASFEDTQATSALLKILALGNQDLEADRIKPVADVVAPHAPQ